LFFPATDRDSARRLFFQTFLALAVREAVGFTLFQRQ
jgi:hypothetical protein